MSVTAEKKRNATAVENHVRMIAGRTLLNSDLEANLLLKKYLDGFCGMLPGSADVPVMGLFSMVQSTTPTRLYDLPRMVGEFGTTAFTDGVNVFIHTGFFRMVWEEHQAAVDYFKKHGKYPDGTTGNPAPPPPSSLRATVIHELLHKVMGDTVCVLDENEAIDREAKDVYINLTINSMPEAPIGPWFKEHTLGQSEEEKQRFSGKSPAQIAALLREARASDAAGGDPGDGGAPGVGKGTQGAKGSGKGAPGKRAADGASSGGKGVADEGAPGNSGGEFDRHKVDPVKLREILAGEGVPDEVLDELGLPKDHEEAVERARAAQGKIEEVVEAAARIAERERQRGGSMPGSHIVDAVGEMIRSRKKPLLTMGMVLGNLICGEGAQTGIDDRVPDSIFYVSPEDIGMGDPCYIEGQIPAKSQKTFVVVIDTSGSVWGSDYMEQAIAEVFNLVDSNSMAANVVVLSADTVVRGKPVQITRETLAEFRDQGMPVFGGGGTDMETAIAQSISAVKTGEVTNNGALIDLRKATFINVTDGEFFIPRVEALANAADPFEVPQLAFILPEGFRNIDDFRSEVSSFATCYELKEGEVLDFDADEMRRRMAP